MFKVTNFEYSFLLNIITQSYLLKRQSVFDMYPSTRLGLGEEGANNAIGIMKDH